MDYKLIPSTSALRDSAATHFACKCAWSSEDNTGPFKEILSPTATTLTFRILHLILVSLGLHNFVTVAAAIVRPVQTEYLVPDTAPTRHGRAFTRVERRQHHPDPPGRDHRDRLLCLLF